MKILHLTLKKKWFDMVASGEKKEEYRDIKIYWWTRLVQCGECFRDDGELRPVDRWELLLEKKFDVVVFKNGYQKDAKKITLEWLGMERGEGKKEWGAEPNKEYFVIKLGEILNK